jgi:hypothetical protein
MNKNAIYLSGWEYNKLIADDPIKPIQSGLPAQVLWDGAAQFWLFEKVFCSQESFDGDMAAAHELGWSTGYIFEDLKKRGFLVPIKWSDFPKLKTEINERWLNLKNDYNQNKLLQLLNEGRDDILEEVKLLLLKPILKELNCLNNISPNSIRHWIKSNQKIEAVNPTTKGICSIAEPLTKQSMRIRSGFKLCQPPGTGVPKNEIKKQQRVEQQIQKPLIPDLLLGLLPQKEYHNALLPTSSVYKPINDQLMKDYKKHVDRLERLRDIAEKNLWKELHGDWLPRLEEKPSFLIEFQKLIGDALNRTKFDPHLKRFTDVAIITTSAVIGYTSGTIAHSIGADPLVTGTVAAATGGSAKKILDDIHEKRRKASDTLTVFYQKARQII